MDPPFPALAGRVEGPAIGMEGDPGGAAQLGEQPGSAELARGAPEAQRVDALGAGARGADVDRPGGLARDEGGGEGDEGKQQAHGNQRLKPSR